MSTEELFYSFLSNPMKSHLSSYFPTKKSIRQRLCQKEIKSFKSHSFSVGMPLCPDFCSLGGDKTCKTKELSEKNVESVVLVLQGGFYHAEGKSADLAGMTGYKLRKTKTGEVECGFPFGSLDKIMKLFEDKRVNYLVYRKDEIVHEYSKGVVLNEYLKDANIPPPVPKTAKKPKEKRNEKSPESNIRKRKNR